MNPISINEERTKAAFRPAGFSEIRDAYETLGRQKLSTREIKQHLTKNYNMTDGQVAGSIKRACKKKLLVSMGHAEYIYNSEYPDMINDFNQSDESLDYEEKSIQNIVYKAVSDCISSIDVQIKVSNVKPNELVWLLKVIEKLKNINDESKNTVHFDSVHN